MNVARVALALPEVSEQDHHGMASYRVTGKIFATVPDETHVRLMLPEPDIRALVAEAPQVFSTVYWGKRLSAVAVDVTVVDGARFAELVAEAWAAKAPRRLTRER